MSVAQTAGPLPSLAAEDAARADLYGLLAQLFSTGPDAPLLAAIVASGIRYGGEATLVGQAWSALVVAARATEPIQACLEHAELFVGTGQAPVSIYASHYLSETWKEHTLVELRDLLPQMGLTRRQGVTQPEDHLAALLEVMRHLVLRGSDEAALVGQRAFFNRYLGPWHGAFCAAVAAQPARVFYRNAASLLNVFLALEEESFQLDC